MFRRKRIVRLYNTDGSLLTTTTVEEERVNEMLEGDQTRGGAMYDEFE